MLLSGGIGATFKSYELFADQLDMANGPNWNTTVGAPIGTDPSNSALKVRNFDDTVAEGVGFMVTIPSFALNMTVRYKTRAVIAGATAAVLRLSHRVIAHNTPVSVWQPFTVLPTINILNNTNYKFTELTDSLAGWALTAGNTYQFDLSRNVAHIDDTLVGDLALLSVEIDFII